MGKSNPVPGPSFPLPGRFKVQPPQRPPKPMVPDRVGDVPMQPVKLPKNPGKK